MKIFGRRLRAQPGRATGGFVVPMTLVVAVAGSFSLTVTLLTRSGPLW